jgi:hypothetical protein
MCRHVSACCPYRAYRSRGYFKQRTTAREIGSSIKQHKVQPVDSENSADKPGMADSTMLRNIGVGPAYALPAQTAAG